MSVWFHLTLSASSESFSERLKTIEGLDWQAFFPDVGSLEISNRSLEAEPWRGKMIWGQ
jgi:hypothetical protein